MRVATYNLLHGMSVRDGVVDRDRICDAVRSLDADIVGLQEVDRAQPRSHHFDMTDDIARAVGATSWRYEPTLIGTPGESWRAADGTPPGDEPSYGVALVSRLPVVSWHVVRLPAAPMRSPVVVQGPPKRVLMLLDDEPRIALAAIVDAPGGPCTVAVTHLSFVPGWNLRQLRRVRRALADLPAPRILLGDFNLPGRLPAAVTRWPDGFAGATYPNPAPKVQLDHVLVERGRLVATGGGVAELPVSDHCALWVDIAAPG
jgi:endonuclease/exonuclease/phosphatase family metal-dependent hydrolase